ncbi:hypothetical protein Hypma_003629 [Hypsizygus marmoreus]|uniref:MYND-type domain-containing protein n=1 Tax=Hypsizygus marmoreus TaxID=39966 RepID=A0A369J5Y3_HYPMA|nr:hypothetical protein Hypma_003629 [Hypsizygus marmoreus]
MASFYRQMEIGGRKIPDYEDGAMAWNAGWERVATATSHVFNENPPTPVSASEASEYILVHYQDMYRAVCTIQYNLTVTAMYMPTGFEREWQAAKPTVRRDHFLEGHIRVSILGHEDFRAHCGDITLASLEKTNGGGFLKLLKEYLHDDPSDVPTTPITYPYKATSGMPLPDSTNNVAQASASLERDLYLGFFLFHTLNSWKGDPRPRSGQSTKTSFKEDLDPEMMKRFKSTMKPSEYKQMKQAMLSKYAAADRCCEGCGKPESTTMKHMQCKKCADLLNRRMCYCSRQCQKDDWPRHKKICGKKMTLEAAQSTTLPSRVPAAVNHPDTVKIGPVVGGYTRSVALTAQVNRLHTMPEVDYFIAKASGEFSPLFLDAVPDFRTAFHEIRDRALTTGDRSAAAALGEFVLLIGAAAVPDGPLPLQPVMDQLVSEYGESIKQDIHVLEAISYHHHNSIVPEKMQVERKSDGHEVFDVTVLPKNWQAIEDHFAKYNRKKDPVWNPVFRAKYFAA